MGTIALKIDKLNETKEKLKQELLFKGFTEEEIGPEFSKMANCIKTIGNANLPQWFKDSIVCWYDPKRLRMTNEEMLALKEAGKPLKLIDFSGNGLDMDLKNFAWGGMSGVGGYNHNLSQFNLNTINALIKDTKAEINGIPTKGRLVLEVGKGMTPFYKFKVKITFKNYKDYGLVLYLKSENIEIQIKSEGIYELPYKDQNTGYFGFVWNNAEIDPNYKCIIELLPEYPNVLVFDGKDDYGISENLPLLNNIKGYTIIAKRKWILGTGFLASKMTSTNNSNSSFAFEAIRENKIRTISFKNDVSKDLTFYPNLISFLTLNNYNNSIFFNAQNILDSNILYLGTYASDSSTYWGGALYNFLLFNKELTPEQIEWVKTNIVDPVDKLEFQSEYQNN